jgi:hypothetical protein
LKNFIVELELKDIVVAVVLIVVVELEQLHIVVVVVEIELVAMVDNIVVRFVVFVLRSSLSYPFFSPFV